jgi:hypothetical protein
VFSVGEGFFYRKSAISTRAPGATLGISSWLGIGIGLFAGGG